MLQNRYVDDFFHCFGNFEKSIIVILIDHQNPADVTNKFPLQHLSPTSMCQSFVVQLSTIGAFGLDVFELLYLYIDDKVYQFKVSN